MMGRKGLIALSVAAASACAGMAHAVVQPAQQSDAVVDSMGINIHAGTYLGYNSSAYVNWNGIIDVVDDIGFRQVRDHGIEVDRLNQLTDATGVKLMAITEWQDNTSGVLKLNQSKLPDRIAQTKQLRGLAWIEGPNEYDGYPDPNWQDSLLTWMSSLYTTAKNDPQLKHIPVLAPSMFGTEERSVFAPYADLGNMHLYPIGREPMIHHYWTNLRASWVVAGKPVWATEAGYNNGFENTNNNFGISELASYKYIPRMYVDYFKAGTGKTFIYELADDWPDPDGNEFQEWHYGMVRHDHSYKPVAYAVRNMIDLLEDVGDEFTPGGLDYSITGGNEKTRHHLFQKRDGSFMLALWQDDQVYDNDNRVDMTNAPVPISLNVNTPIVSGETYLLDSLNPTSTFGGASALPLNLLDEMMLVHLIPPAANAHQWTKNGDGAWTEHTNWDTAIPWGDWASAVFGEVGSGPHVVNLPGDARVAEIHFDSAASYSIVGDYYPITIDTPAFGKIAAETGSHSISAPLILARDTRIHVDSDAALAITNLQQSPDAIITKKGSGTLEINRIRAKKIEVDGGTARVIDGSGTSVVDSVGVDEGATLDLRDNKLVVRGGDIGWLKNGAYNGVHGLIADDRLTSSLLDEAGRTTLAVAKAEEVGYDGGVFGGVSVAAGDVLVMLTWGGDADLNGELNGDDYFHIDSNILSGNLEPTFHKGDFNLDGQINGDDYFVIDSNFVYAQGSSPFPVGLSAIPEPAGVAFMAAGAAFLTRRRARGRG